MREWFSQLTPGDWTLLVGLFANALATVYSVRFLNRKVESVHVGIERVVTATNGMKDALVAAAELTGELRGKAEEAAKHLPS